jgi:hypothetical protein
MDNTSPQNITALRAMAFNLIERESDTLDDLCDKLTEDDGTDN